MSESLITDVVAATEYCVTAGGTGAPFATLHIGRPQRHEDGDWTCSHQIIGVDGFGEVRAAAGIDSLQALYLCLYMANARLADLQRRLGVALLDEGGADVQQRIRIK
ncbi:MAG: hypothetical protein ABJE47_16165 [bacterium]